jgi:hypothetical protein
MIAATDAGEIRERIAGRTKSATFPHFLRYYPGKLHPIKSNGGLSMRLFLIPLLVVLLLAVTLSAQQQRYVTVIVLKANLRGTPSTTGRVVAEVRKDETLKLLEERGSWYLVQTASYVGWLHGSTIRFSSAES